MKERPQNSETWIARWRRIARRIRVPLGFVAAGVYLWRLLDAAPLPPAILGSLVLVLPGLWLRGYAAGYVKKNEELTQTGPYAYTRNPLYLGSILIATGFAVALMSVAFALLLVVGFMLIYVPVIVGEEEFLRANFDDYDEYCRRVPRLLPRRVPFASSGSSSDVSCATGVSNLSGASSTLEGRFSLNLYRRHREYRSALGAAVLYASLLISLAWHQLYMHG